MGPNTIIGGPAINNPVLNSKKRYNDKLDRMKNDGFTFSSFINNLGK